MPHERPESLAKKLEVVLGELGVGGRVEHANLKHLVADAPPKFFLLDASNRNIGFVLCSSRSAPDLIGRGVQRATEPRNALGDKLGRAVLVPTHSGNLDGLTWALLPYFHSISSNRFIRFVQKRSLTPALLRWLREANRQTLVPSEVGAFKSALDRISGEPFARESASEGLRQLRDGSLKPVSVLAHNDLWLGNILRAPGNTEYPFVVIDWLGSCVRGFAMFDLIRLSQSIGLSRAALAGEIDAQCAILGCTSEQARFHLLCGLGHIATNLEQFPRERFERMARSCWETLTATLASAR